MRAGFTLLEMLAVVLLTTIVLVAAIDFYLDLSNASVAATDETRSTRRAAVLLDRIARDLESAVLIRKPADVDPLEHPWLFLAEPGRSEGADRLKFLRRGARMRASAGAEVSDLELVAWIATPTLDDELEIRRWSAPRLPEGLERDMPPADAAQLVAGGVASFGVLLEDENGDWVDRWDSSVLSDSSELPIAARISVSFYADDDTEEQDGPYVREVVLPLRPIDLQALEERAGILTGADGEGDDEEADEEGDGDSSSGGDDGAVITVRQCADRNPQLVAQLLRNDETGSVADLIDAMGDQPASSLAGMLAPVGGLPANCR